MPKRHTLTLIGLLLTVSLLSAGCGGVDSQPEEGTLQLWIAWGEDPAQIQALFDRYSQANGLPVKVTAGVDSDKVVEAMTSSTPPDLVVLSSSDLIKAYYEQGLIAPLDPWIEGAGVDLDDIYPAPLAQCRTTEGAYLCLPWGGDIYALLWNKDLFKAAGIDPERPPRTMEQLVEYADRLTLYDSEGELVQIGFIPDFSRSHTDLYARMFGGFWISDDGRLLAANSRPVVDALNWQRQFYSMHGAREVSDFASSLNRYMSSRHPVSAGRRMSCQACHPSAPRKKGPDGAFYAGKVAMAVEGQWQVGPGFITKLQPDLHYGVAPLPPPADHPERARTTVIQGPVALIPTGVKDKDAAADLLAWMMSPEILAEAMLTVSKLPTSRTAAQDPRFRQIPDLGLFMDLMAHANAKHTVTTPISAELNEGLGRVEEELLHEGGEPALLLNELQAEFAPKLKEALAYHDRP